MFFFTKKKKFQKNKKKKKKKKKISKLCQNRLCRTKPEEARFRKIEQRRNPKIAEPLRKISNRRIAEPLRKIRTAEPPNPKTAIFKNGAPLLRDFAKTF